MKVACYFFATKSVIFGLMLLLNCNLEPDSTCNLFLYLFFVKTRVENAFSHRSVVEKICKCFSASSDISF